MSTRPTPGRGTVAAVRYRLGRVLVVSAVAAGFAVAGTAGGAQAAPAPHSAGWQQTPLPEPLGNLVGVAGTGAADQTWATGFSVPADDEEGPLLPMAARWNGTAWVDTPVPVADGKAETRLNSAPAVVSLGDVWAVGDIFDPADDLQQALIEHWNGTAWTQTPTADLPDDSELYGISAVSASDIWAGGVVNGKPGLLHYDGHDWSPVSTTAFDGFGGQAYVAGLSASGPDDAWAVGSVGLAAHYDGRTWTATPLPDLGGDEGWLENVRTSPVYGTWAVGYRVGPDHIRHPLALHLADGAWQPVATPEPDNTQLQDVAFTTTGPEAFGYAVGTSDEVGYGLTLPVGDSGKAAPITMPSGTTGINGATTLPGGKGVWIVGTGDSDSEESFPPFAARTA